MELIAEPQTPKGKKNEVKGLLMQVQMKGVWLNLADYGVNVEIKFCGNIINKTEPWG